MRLGLATGTRVGAKLWAPFRRGVPVDEAGGATLAYGTGTRPAPAVGYFADALQFGSGIATLQWTLASALTLPVTLECWAYHDDPAMTYSLMAQTAGSNKVFYLEASGSTVTGAFYNGAGTLFSVTNDAPLVMTAARWRHYRLVATTAGLWLLVDGALVGYRTSAPASLATTSLGAVYVGGESGRVTSSFAGRLAEVRILPEADTSELTCSPNLLPSRVERRQVHVHEVDLGEQLEARAWVDDAAGGFYLPVADVNLLGWSNVLPPDDLLALVQTTGTTVTRLAQVGSVAAVDVATEPSWCYDLATDRLYVSEDVATAYAAAQAADAGTTDAVYSLVLTVRCRVADRGTAYGGRYALPAFLPGAGLGERSTARWNQAMGTGGGASHALAAQAPGLPAGLVSEEATGIVWPGARARTLTAVQSAPAVEWPVDFVGLVDAQPENDRDTAPYRVLAEQARFFRAPIGNAIADKATYPYMDPAHDGYAFPSLFGAGLQAVLAICLDTRARPIPGLSPFNGWRFKFADHAVARVASILLGGVTYMDKFILRLDLSVAEFWISNRGGIRDSYYVAPTSPPIFVACDGYGTPVPSVSLGSRGADGWATSIPALPFGNASDCALDGDAQIRRYVQIGYGTATPVFDDATLADTYGRARLYRRQSDAFGSPSDLVGKGIAGLATETLTFPYFDVDAEAWKAKDAVKADARTTIRDSDILAEKWTRDMSQVSAKAIAVAHSYARDANGQLVRGSAVNVALRTDPKYGTIRNVLKLPTEPGGFYTVADAQAFVGRAQPLMERPTFFGVLTIGARLKGVEVMDPLECLSSELARMYPDAGVDFRPLSVAPQADGTTIVELMSEANFPDDATSISSLRDPAEPFVRYHYRDPAGTPCATGGPTVVGTDMAAIGGGFGPYPSVISHQFEVRAIRSGGTVDTDFKVRLVVIESDGSTGATIAEVDVGTDLDFYATTTVANLPTTDKRVQMQSLGANGASGTVYLATLQSKEGIGVQASEPFPPERLACVGYAPGATCPATAAITLVPDLGSISYPAWRVGTYIRGIIFYDAADAVGWDLNVGEYGSLYLGGSTGDFDSEEHRYRSVQSWTGLVGSGWLVFTGATSIGRTLALDYTLASGSPKVYAFALEAIDGQVIG